MFNNRIGAAGATALAAALQTNTTLTSMYLDDNGIGAAGATALATALQTNTTLTELNLDDNDVGNAGATALATALQTNTMLTSLSLRFNDIGNAGATALATTLQTNITLASLNLENNDIGDVAAVAFLSAHPRCIVLLDPNHFDGAHGCCSRLLQAGASWDLSRQRLSCRDVDWLAVALGDIRVCCSAQIGLDTRSHDPCSMYTE